MQFRAPDDGRKDRPRHVVRFTRINNLRERCVLLVVLQEMFLVYSESPTQPTGTVP